MAGHRSFLRVGLILAAAAALVFEALPAQAGIARGSFHKTNLVSDIPGLALVTDSNLVNPWGLSSSSTSFMWVSDNNAAVSTLYNNNNNTVKKVPLEVSIPAPGDPQPDGPFTGTPTGTVFNPTDDFSISVVTPTGTKSGKSFFLFATEDGTLLGWNPNVDMTHAVIAKDNSTEGAVYKGLTNGSVTDASGTKNFLYAANFKFATVDVFDGQFHPVTLPGAFTDSSLPAHFAPFGIQNINGLIYVTYALQNAEKHDDVKGPGNGFVDIYTTSGTLVRRFASGGSLNSPWGLALAPATFGNFHNDILVGNFGDGRINAFTTEGRFRGQLKERSAPIEIEGLWGLRFGNGGNGGAVDSLFFAAGIMDEKHGLYGKVQNVS